MPTTSYFTDQMLAKTSAAEVREIIQSDIVTAAAAAPANPTIGQIYFRTTAPAHFFGWNGAAWVQLD